MAPFATLYTSLPNPRVNRARAAAKMNGLELEMPEFTFGVTNKTPEFLAKWPLGKIPTLETPDGFHLAESAAIAQFIAESGPMAGQLLGTNPKDRANIQQWVMFNDFEISINCGKIGGPMLGRSPYDEKTVSDAHKVLQRALGALEKQLKGREFVATEECSMADLALASPLHLAFKFFMDKEYREEYPEIVRWFLGVLEIPEVREIYGEPLLCDVRMPPHQ